MTTRIIKCSCAHADQDFKYGAGMRVHNVCKVKPTMPPSWRCTVCGKER